MQPSTGLRVPFASFSLEARDGRIEGKSTQLDQHRALRWHGFIGEFTVQRDQRPQLPDPRADMTLET
jgi:hypothetical protein